jgi:hypothetical protein
VTDDHDRRPGGPRNAGTSRADADLDSLDKLVGTWTITGDASGTTRYEWMEGKFFMLQHVELIQGDQPTKGLEVIGHLRPYNAERSADIRSRYYSNTGETLDYTYEVDNDVLTIWFGERGSPAYYRGTFTPDGDACNGAWVYPGGGGYESNMTRARSEAT